MRQRGREGAAPHGRRDSRPLRDGKLTRSRTSELMIPLRALLIRNSTPVMTLSDHRVNTF